MTQSEIITELKQCKGNRAALEFAVKAMKAVTCETCYYCGFNMSEYPCSKCGGLNVCEYWMAYGVTDEEAIEEIEGYELLAETDLNSEDGYFDEDIGNNVSGILNALEELKNATKYRWHDLRKDPDDLPKPDDESVMFYCILENHIHDPHPIPLYFEPEYNAFGYYNNSYSVANGADAFDTVEAMGYEKVIAWREIEPFEEE